MKIEAKQLSATIQEQVKTDVATLKGKGIAPKLTVILATDDLSAISYAKSKQRMAHNLGIDYEILSLEESASNNDILDVINNLNNDKLNHGILIEFPMRPGLDSNMLQNSISPLKDVDGLTAKNLGLIAMGQEKNAILPATPQACIELANSVVNTSGQRIAVIGRGRTVGRPLSEMLINRDATITVCHSKTVNIKDAIKDCSIVFVAIGKPHFITEAHLSEKQIVIDAGINYLNDKLVGDLNPTAYSMLESYSPVPGGVGSLTSTIIFRNLIKGITLQMEVN